MKYSAAIICFILMMGCTDNGVRVREVASNDTDGRITFSLAKSTLPQGIASLTFSLSNVSTEESLSKDVMVSTDTLIQVAFDHLTAGTWHVKVVAKDSSSGEKFSGEGDALVSQGQTTQLNLYLNSVTPGTGSLVITVNWSNTALFYDYSGNPILQKTGAWYDVRGVENASILFDGTRYKMWFLNYGMLNYQPYGTIGLAESADGTTWTRIADTVMTPTRYTWDAGVVAPGPVIRENGMYTMYYTGSVASGVGYNIGMATSEDGRHWTKTKTVMSGVSNIGAPSVVKANDQYYLYYVTVPTYGIQLATSADGVNWQPYAGSPVLTPTESWEGMSLTGPSVIYESNTFTMVYSDNASSQSFGMATSTDGIHWVKEVRNPVFSKANTLNGWAAYAIGYPFLVRVGKDLRIYYTGITSASGGIDRLGYAIKR